MINSAVYEKAAKWSIILFVIIILISGLLTTSYPTGEWDDYLFTTASLLNDQNMCISNNDIIYAYTLFPEIGAWNKFSGSGFHTSSGDELPWYFGTYSVLCIPMVWLLNFLQLTPIYAFILTNILVYSLTLYCVYKKLLIKAKAKLLLILLLILNPAVFYIFWISAEVLIFSLIILIMISWTNQKYRKAAILVSIASSLNPTILMLALAITADYISKLVMAEGGIKIGSFVDFLKVNYADIAKYFFCYVIALVPLIYNYYYTGYINLTAAMPRYNDAHLVLPRFWAYLTDLNFGILPYFGFIFLLSSALFFLAVFKRVYRYILMMLGFLGVILAYSFMAHINCGMSGISRYNAWSAPIMIFSVIVHYDLLFSKRLWKFFTEGVICISLVCNSLIIHTYGLIGARNISYTCMTPIAEYVLTYFPALYNPLPSTFNSRISNIDGGYQYKLPLFYKDKEGYIRKILAQSTFSEDILSNIAGTEEAMEYLKKKLSALSGTEAYIAIGQQYKLFLCKPYKLGEIIWFCSEKRNADDYVQGGLSSDEKSFAWTDDGFMKVRMKIDNAPALTNYLMHLNIANIFTPMQHVIVESNGRTIWSKEVCEKGIYEFTIPDISNGTIELNFKFPDAISPSDFNGAQDIRKLALALVNAVITAED